ncbi:hypothetical protein ES332_A10G218200v1 [Gossypium tomentosum]|uniref:Protein kinase domain-containing protein n=1 Tax=Gossypium tomentosum TaxID=34277 RepID=A0A5D2NT49_GOSTO|nr:hypothetical protein ES332_A10G218200v1 [Gossypium tomentosum]
MIVRFALSFSLLLLLITDLASAANSTAKPGCKGSCGDVRVPYPFGIGPNCSLNAWFEVSCNETSTPPTILLKRTNMEVLNFSLRSADYDPELEYHRVKSPVVSMNCSGRETSLGVDLTGSPFFFSEYRNKFLAAGCNSTAFLAEVDTKNTSCRSACIGDALFGSNPYNICHGTCCERELPSALKTFNATFDSQSDGCKLAYVVENNWASNVANWSGLQNMEAVGAVLDWAIPKEDFELSEDGREYTCREYGLELSDPNIHKSIRCFCKSGYEGNAYLPDGCQDIDECLDELKCGDATCVNKPGHYVCRRRKRKTWILPLGIGLGFAALCLVMCLVMGGRRSYKYLKKRMKMKLKKKNFKRNGGLLLQQQMFAKHGSLESTRIFTSKELDKATDNFNKDRVLGQGGQGTIYKGMLADERIVAVKKSKGMVADKVEEFINEVVILSQINHRNVVKLIGCCLETEVPLLVYEFISNGTVYQYLHDQSEEFVLSWETRLRIAKESAEALAYLHSSASIPIYHRDIKSTNILLDEKFKAKVSDFGISRSVSIDQTHLTTHVQGTFGYLDPEYFQSSQFTDKSDVYSFGVVLVELLTGEKPVSFEREENSRSLASYFTNLMETNQVMDIFDSRIVKEVKHEEVMMVAKLAYQCLSLSGKKRPTMKEVSIELEQIVLMQKGSNVLEISETFC